MVLLVHYFVQAPPEARQDDSYISAAALLMLWLALAAVFI
jgi:hypothetical protein